MTKHKHFNNHDASDEEIFQCRCNNEELCICPICCNFPRCVTISFKDIQLRMKSDKVKENKNEI